MKPITVTSLNGLKTQLNWDQTVAFRGALTRFLICNCADSYRNPRVRNPRCGGTENKKK